MTPELRMIVDISGIEPSKRDRLNLPVEWEGLGETPGIRLEERWDSSLRVSDRQSVSLWVSSKRKIQVEFLTQEAAASTLSQLLDLIETPDGIRNIGFLSSGLKEAKEKFQKGDDLPVLSFQAPHELRKYREKGQNIYEFPNHEALHRAIFTLISGLRDNELPGHLEVKKVLNKIDQVTESLWEEDGGRR